ncbi:unnamed protein product, partial [marine sediment metagenome]
VGRNEEKTGTITIRKKIGRDIKEIKPGHFIRDLKKVIRDKEKVY